MGWLNACLVGWVVVARAYPRYSRSLRPLALEYLLGNLITDLSLTKNPERYKVGLPVGGLVAYSNKILASKLLAKSCAQPVDLPSLAWIIIHEHGGFMEQPAMSWGLHKQV